jgi:hypothetical protein
MQLPSQVAPVNRAEVLTPSIDLKHMTVIGAEPNDPAPFETGQTCRVIYDAPSPVHDR